MLMIKRMDLGLKLLGIGPLKETIKIMKEMENIL